jgi:hypothetical protein
MPMKDGVPSPASRLMDEAIELAIEEKAPYPEHSMFLDADTPYTEREMKRAAKEGCSVVLVSPDLSTRIVKPEEILGKNRDAA